MAKDINPLFAMLLLASAQLREQPNLKPTRRPMSRKLECPDCGQEVLLVRSTTNGKPCLDVHFLMEDGEHMVAGLLFETETDRDDKFMKLVFEDTKSIFGEMMIASLGGSMGLAETVLGSGRRW